MLGRIGPFDAGTKDSDGPSIRTKCAVVRRAIDAAGHPAHDRKSGRDQTAGEIARDAPAVIARAPGTDDRHRALVLGNHRSFGVEHRRRIGDHAQPIRIFVGVITNNANPSGARALQFVFDFTPSGVGPQRLDYIEVQTSGFELCGRSLKSIGRIVERNRKFFETDPAQPFHTGKRNPERILILHPHSRSNSIPAR